MSEAEGDAINQTANPPISEVVVLARSTDAYEGETIVSNDDVSVAQSQSQNYNNNSSTLSGRKPSHCLEQCEHRQSNTTPESFNVRDYDKARKDVRG